jgi:hypothetical protein
MSDGASQGPAIPPEQQRAQEEMAKWLAEHRPIIPIAGPFGFATLAATVQNLVAAAGAGQFAVNPNIGKAVIDHLTKVQDVVDTMATNAQRAAADPRFGGGYAEEVGRFVKGVAAGEAGSAEEMLTKFWDEIQQMKVAVGKTMGLYVSTDDAGRKDIDTAGAH